MTWLSIDGGNEAKAERACYVAEWADFVSGLIGVRSLTMAQARAYSPPGLLVVEVAVERTQADGRLARGKTTPGTMVGLAWNTAAIAYTLARGAPVHEYTISNGTLTDWIGGINKAALHQRIWAALTPAERAIVAAYGRSGTGRKRGLPGSGTVDDVTNAIIYNNVRQATAVGLLHHDWYNVLDAVGVGLFHLDRVGKGAAPKRPTR